MNSPTGSFPEAMVAALCVRLYGALGPLLHARSYSEFKKLAAPAIKSVRASAIDTDALAARMARHLRANGDIDDDAESEAGCLYELKAILDAAQLRDWLAEQEASDGE